MRSFVPIAIALMLFLLDIKYQDMKMKNKLINLNGLSVDELSIEQMLNRSGGLSIVSHMLRAASGSAFGIAYWIGYGVSKVVGD